MFEVEVLYKDKYVYLYHLEIDHWGIIREILSYKTKRGEKYKTVLDVSRSECDVRCANEQSECNMERCSLQGTAAYEIDVLDMEDVLGKRLIEIMQKQSSGGLFVTRFAVLGIKHAIIISDYIKNNLCPETYYINVDIYKAIKNEEKDLKILNDPRFVEIFKLVDGSIAGIEIDHEKPFRKSRVIRKNRNGIEFKRELEDESSGVSEFFAWSVQVFQTVYENKVIFADEMDRVLNPVLSDRVISFIHGKQHYGQFIFTTHNILHLDLKNYMKEQIYFITKNIESLESELYSLADFPEIRYETTKIYEFYLKGILGRTASE